MTTRDGAHDRAVGKRAVTAAQLVRCAADEQRRVRATLGCGVLLAVLLPAAQTPAARFGDTIPAAGVGASASRIALSSAAAGADGSVVIAGTRAIGDGRQVVVWIGRGGQPAMNAVALGPAGAITSQPRAVLDEDGRGGVVFARGKTVYLSVCGARSCAAPVKVGASALSPQADLAVQPGTGRLTVIWRGRSANGTNRLQWRVSTNRRLGAVHTLGEFGDAPRIGTDGAGRSVAVWTRYPIRPGRPAGLRTASRRAGEFTRPVTLEAGNVYAPQLVTGADGETIVAWLASRSFDVQSPRAQARVATRTAGTGFSPPTGVGGPDSAGIALDRGPDGHAVLALDRQLDDTTAIVQAAVRAPRQSFGVPQDVSAPSFVSTAFGATAAIEDQGVATVAWASGAGPAAEVLAARSNAGGMFGVPQSLPTSAIGTPQQRPLVAAGGTRTLTAWITQGRVVISQASG